jgi:hypothetical protein
MYVIYMAVKISLVADDMFPITPLPKASFFAIAPRYINPLARIKQAPTFLSHVTFDYGSTRRKPGVIFRYGPDGMQMIR